MKKVLCFQLTAGGATVLGTAGSLTTLIMDDNQPKAAAAAPWAGIPKKMAIVKIQAMGALMTAFRVIRGSHQSDNVDLVPLADTQADLHQAFDFEREGLPGIELIPNETLHIGIALSGAGTGLVYVELDDSYQSANYRGVLVAGSAAAVALGVPVESGANLAAANYVSTDTYEPVMAHVVSTTIDAAWLGVQKKSWVLVEISPAAVCPGAPARWLQPRQSAALRSTGLDIQQGLSLMVSCFAADAAAVQLINVLWRVVSKGAKVSSSIGGA